MSRYHFPITLCMIVKDEAHIIERCLDSVKDHITGWVIIDTGSTDGTQDLIREELADIPGVLLEQPFVNFAYNRTNLVNEARGWVLAQTNGLNPGYLLLLDADHVLHGDFSGVGDADGYLIELPGWPISYRMPYLVGADIPWKYFSVTHEYLGTDGVNFQYENLDSCTIEHFGDGGTRHEKFERDLRLLQEEYDKDPTNERTVYYLAQTYEGLGNTERAIELFKERTQLGGWDQEIFWAYFKIAELTSRVEDYLTAFIYRPTRLEPLQRVMKKLNEQGNFAASAAIGRSAPFEPTTDHFFVERWVEEYGLLFEMCLAAWYTGDKESAKEGWEEILSMPDVPDGYKESCKNNLQFC